MSLVVNARAVFGEFQKAFDSVDGAMQGRSVIFGEDDRTALGLTSQQLDGALQALARKGLVERETDDGWVLTDLGCDACENPVIVDELLPPPAF